MYKETLSFLKELSRNNNKAWFDANRKQYKIVRAHWLRGQSSVSRQIPVDIKENANGLFLRGQTRLGEKFVFADNGEKNIKFWD